MSGIDIQFNIAKGRVTTYFANVDAASPANSKIIVVPLEATGLVADGTLADYDELNALLGGASNEQTTMGRKTLAGADVTVTVDDTNDRVDLIMATAITWTAATGNACGKLLYCYDPDSTGGTDADIIPLLAYSFDAIPDGSDIVVNDHANGLIRIP